MADINLTQDEADKLMAMEKRAADDKQWLFPLPGDRVAIPLTSLDKRENFMLDVTRAQIKLTKATYQNRARAVIILMRLDRVWLSYWTLTVKPRGQPYATGEE
jgi:hypothetical protein